MMATICNCSLRYVQEFFLELCLSMTILAAAIERFDMAAWVMTLFIFAACIAFIVFVVTRFFTGGPYIPKSYQSGTLLSSYWSVRPLRDSLDTSSLIEANLKHKNNESKEITKRNAAIVHDLALACPIVTEQHFLGDSIRVVEKKEVGPPHQLAQSPSAIGTQQMNADGAKSSSIREQAQIRAQLEASAQVSNYYSTLYYGMIKNHPHGAATVYPLLFVLRRIAYALVIVLMVDGIRPYFGALILTLTSLFVLMFIAIEAHWEQRMINLQEFVNECVFYTMCIGLICFTDVLVDTSQSRLLGWLMIGLALNLMLFNSVIIVYELWHCFRRTCLRCRNRRTGKRKIREAQSKVVPLSNEKIDVVIKAARDDSIEESPSEQISD